MTIAQFLDAVIGFQPENYIITDAGAYLRWIDQRYIASVVVLVVVVFMLFYGLINLTRVIASGVKK